MAHQYDGNGVIRQIFDRPTGEANPIMTREQLQWLAEYISLQTLIAVQDHEYRVHEPNNPEALRMVKQNDGVRRRVLEKLTAIFCRS